jgi:hypothetical protein
MPSESVVVVGAGPYGLGAAAHLRAAGVHAHVLGEPMESWSRHMPRGMLLRSGPRASHLSDPRRRSTLDAFAAQRGAPVADPIPVEDFVGYGRWFAERELGDVDRRRATRIGTATDGRFAVELEDGTILDADRVVIAAGLAPFARRPAPLADLPPELVSHAWDHADLRAFAGQRVAVVGGGQSALESAALLQEGGADVEVLTPRPIFWLADKNRPRTLKDRAYPPTEVGGIVTGWVAAAPDVYRRLPEARRPAIAAGCLRPAGAFWLRARLEDVPMTAGQRVRSAAAAPGGGVDLVLDDGSQRHVDHVLLGTGYHVDVARYPFLGEDVVARIEVRDGSPVLRRGLETSVPGLHMLGAASAKSFGPIMRFVAGSWYAAPALARYVAGRRPAPLTVAFA